MQPWVLLAKELGTVPKGRALGVHSAPQSGGQRWSCREQTRPRWGGSRPGFRAQGRLSGSSATFAGLAALLRPFVLLCPSVFRGWAPASPQPWRVSKQHFGLASSSKSGTSSYRRTCGTGGLPLASEVTCKLRFTDNPGTTCHPAPRCPEAAGGWRPPPAIDVLTALDGASDDPPGSTLVEFYLLLLPSAPAAPALWTGAGQQPLDRGAGALDTGSHNSGACMSPGGGVPSSPSLRLCELGQLTRPLSLAGLSVSVTWQKAPRSA